LIDKKTFYSLDEVCKCDFVVPTVPIRNFEETIIRIKDLISAESVLFEVCSIKVYPEKILKKHFSKYRHTRYYLPFQKRVCIAKVQKPVLWKILSDV